MYGDFGTRVTVKGTDPEFIMDLTVSPPASFVAAYGQEWQMWSAFQGWDVLSTPTAVSDINLMLEFTLQGAATTGWIAYEDYTYQYCTAKHLDSIKVGGYPAVSLKSSS